MHGRGGENLTGSEREGDNSRGARTLLKGGKSLPHAWDSFAWGKKLHTTPQHTMGSLRGKEKKETYPPAPEREKGGPMGEKGSPIWRSKREGPHFFFKGEGGRLMA